jgi:hypothetical protein
VPGGGDLIGVAGEHAQEARRDGIVRDSAAGIRVAAKAGGPGWARTRVHLITGLSAFGRRLRSEAGILHIRTLIA